MSTTLLKVTDGDGDQWMALCLGQAIEEGDGQVRLRTRQLELVNPILSWAYLIHPVERCKCLVDIMGVIYNYEITVQQEQGSWAVEFQGYLKKVVVVDSQSWDQADVVFDLLIEVTPAEMGLSTKL